MENDTMQSAWDLVAPSIAQEDAITSSKGCSTLQLSTYEKENDEHVIIMRFIMFKGCPIKTV